MINSNLKEATRISGRETRLPETVPPHSLPSDIVAGSRGETLGRIKELIIDPDSQDIVYAVVAFERVMAGISRKFAVPWSELSLHANGSKFILNVSRDQMRKILFRALAFSEGPLTLTSISLQNLLPKSNRRADNVRKTYGAGI